MYLRDSAVILHAEPWREHDLRVTLFGREHGKMLAVARGARKWQARHRGHLDALNEIDAMLVPGAAYDTLAVARSLRPRPALRRSLSFLAIIGSAADMVIRLTEPRLSEPRIYNLLIELLDLASERELSGERRAFLFAAVTLKLLDVLGYAPDLERCERCRDLLADEPWIAAGTSAIVCAHCRPRAASEGRTLRAFPFFSWRLTRFLRHRPLSEALAVTAPSDILQAASGYVACCLEAAPLTHPPHFSLTHVAWLA